MPARIAASQKSEPPDEWEQKQTEARRAHEEERRLDPRIHVRLPYRSGTSFFDDRRDHVYLVNLPDDEEEQLPLPRRLTDGNLHYGAPAWMPDGSAILTAATRDPEANSLFAYYDILRVPVPAEGRAAAERLTEAGFSYYDPHPSPDGSLIALRRLPDDRPLAAGARVAVLPAAGGELRDLTAETDLDVEQFRWLPDGCGLLYTAGWRGVQAVYRASLDASGAARQQAFPSHQRIVSAFDIGPDGSVAFVAGAPDNPCDLYLWRADGSEFVAAELVAANSWQRTRWQRRNSWQREFA